MHEMSLAEGVLQVIEDTARREGFGRVKEVRLEIGRLSGVEVESLRFCFDAVTRGSVAAGAALEIIFLPGRAWCFPCGKAVEVATELATCPHCGGIELQVQGGDEMRIKDLLVD
ncbi:Hydrogenase maturation factor HybF [Burkholderiales bacterium]|jgi:hydrogenase nickel incorporation protein HypA/HybF|nr:MAG: hydrogenase maturation nickel metallochaperone HypA [Burkholderiales bacterium]CAG0974368.1 Hydrogenase maturation factor HybF [Burkholderiales bacterium]